MNVPFFPNSQDGTHCFQASLAIVLKYFWPERDFTFDELDKISAKTPGKWTWPTTAMMWLMENGFDVRLVEDFDYRAFALRGRDYIEEKCGKKVADAQAENSDIEKEMFVAREFAKMAPLECRVPGIEDIRKFLKGGHLVICNINAQALYGLPGYSGHFVVVFWCGKEGVTLHDPGLPPKPSFKVPWKVFERAWAYPTEREKNILAIRKVLK